MFPATAALVSVGVLTAIAVEVAPRIVVDAATAERVDPAPVPEPPTGARWTSTWPLGGDQFQDEFQVVDDGDTTHSTFVIDANTGGLRWSRRGTEVRDALLEDNALAGGQHRRRTDAQLAAGTGGRLAASGLTAESDGETAQVITLAGASPHGGSPAEPTAQEIMWAHFQREQARGRTPTGAELDRIAGTDNYGRMVLRQWRTGGRIPPAGRGLRRRGKRSPLGGRVMAGAEESVRGL